MNRGTRLAAAAFSGVAVLAVLTGGSFYLTRGLFSSGHPAGRTTVSSRTTAAGCGAAATGPCAGNQAGPADIAVAAPPAVATVPSRQAAASAHTAKTGASPRPTASATATATATATAPGTAGAQPSAEASATPPPAQGGTAAAQVLALINQARAAAGLAALTTTAGLEASSSAHNVRMADGCGLSHQCPGEPPLGQRETDAGVSWTAAGENIGEGGPVADTTAAIAQMAVDLTQSMLNEQPPNDGHRLNILSSTFTHIGIAVYRDSSGTVWLTQDFSN
jgi:uncharacterized protein YkwD